jgi:DNA helicase TIP49 (TBP-interacting protein)
MFNGTISRSNTNKATGKSFTATDLIFTTEDGSKVYINAYAGLKQALKDQEINEGDIITIGYNGSESFTNKWGRSAERFLFDVKVVGN